MVCRRLLTKLRKGRKCLARRRLFMQKFSHEMRSFGGFTLDLTRGCLLRGNQEVELAPIPFEALKYLVKNPGRLISNAELMETLWPETAVTPDSLVQCLREVRIALGDKDKRIVKNVPRRGYVFDLEVSASSAPVTTVTEESGVHLVIEEEETNGRAIETVPSQVAGSAAYLPAYEATILQRIRTAIGQHKLAVAVSVLTLAVAAAGIFYFTRPAEAIDSIAVMPFVNDSGDANLDYLSEGISDNLIERLSGLPNLKVVIAHNVVQRYKGKQIDPQTVGRDLNVRAVLVSRVVQRGNDVSIGLELIDIRDNKHLWSGQYDRNLADIISMQTQIAQDVSEKLRQRLTGQDKQRLASHYTENGEAYRLYLMGRHYQRWGRKEALEKSIDYLRQAIEQDANFAPAYAELGEAYSHLGYGGWIEPKDCLQKEQAAALKALQLDDTLAEAHVVAANIRALNLDWQGADDEYKRAIQLDSSSVRARYAYAQHLIRLGRLDEAMMHLQHAQEVDPLSFEVSEGIGLVLYSSRQYERAIQQYQKTIDIDPLFGHGVLAQAYQAKGMYQEAVAEVEKGAAKGDAQLGYAYAVAGKTAEAHRVLDELRDLSRDRYVSPFRFALVYIGLGDKDQAFAWLSKTFDEDPYRLTGLKANPRFDSLRSDPRCTDLLRRMKLAA